MKNKTQIKYSVLLQHNLPDAQTIKLTIAMKIGQNWTKAGQISCQWVGLMVWLKWSRGSKALSLNPRTAKKKRGMGQVL
jgi:hypothetical protein